MEKSRMLAYISLLSAVRERAEIDGDLDSFNETYDPLLMKLKILLQNSPARGVGTHQGQRPVGLCVFRGPGAGRPKKMNLEYRKKRRQMRVEAP